MESIKILGAGPAGLSSAIKLSKEGYPVEIFERNSDVGGRFHGEFQGLENWSSEKDAIQDLKKMNLTINFNYYPFKNLSISNGDKIWDFKCNKPAFYLLKRGPVPGSLDNGLKDQAQDSGVDIHFNEKSEELQADIIATGPQQSEIFAAARGIVFETEMDDEVLCLVNDRTAFKGYSYLLVADGQATMATVLFDEIKNLNNCFQETKKIYNNLIDLDIKNPYKMGGVGSFSIRNKYSENGKIYIGETAGLQDLLWGFGIKNAIKSGYIAATSIIKGTDYGKTAKEYFDYKLKASIVNRYLWEKLAMKKYSFIVNRIHKSQDPLKYLNHIHKFNLLQRIIYPIALRYMKNRYENLRF